MTIRAKLYAAIVLTILGPLATTVVALQGMAELGDRFDEVHQRAEQEAIARELKFLVTDVNGWQTAYGYANGGPFRARFVRFGRRPGAGAGAGERIRSPASASGSCLIGSSASSRASWSSTPSPGESSRRTDPRQTERILLGPELRRFEAMAATAEELAVYQAEQATATDAAFDDARDDARRRLIAVALGAGVVILLLLVTANDIARMALEGERSARRRRRSAEKTGLQTTRRRDPRRPAHAAACCSARRSPPASSRSLLRIPEILILVAFGALLGPSALDVVDVPLDSLGRSSCSRSASR